MFLLEAISKAREEGMDWSAIRATVDAAQEAETGMHDSFARYVRKAGGRPTEGERHEARRILDAALVGAFANYEANKEGSTELRRWLVGDADPAVRKLVGALPGGSAGLDHVAFEAAMKLVNWGLVSGPFLQRLHEAGALASVVEQLAANLHLVAPTK